MSGNLRKCLELQKKTCSCRFTKLATSLHAHAVPSQFPLILVITSLAIILFIYEFARNN